MIQCPQCKTQYRLEEKSIGNKPSLQFCCTKCGETFVVQFPATSGSSSARPVPVQQHDEFNKRLRTPVAPPAPAESLKATMMKGMTRPWLDQDKVISLVVLHGPLKGQVFPLTKPKVLLGRHDADITLDDSEVSRKHCALEVHGSTAMLADLGSTNGTFVDDEKIETHELHHMSEFRLGSTVMMFSARTKD